MRMRRNLHLSIALDKGNTASHSPAGRGSLHKATVIARYEMAHGKITGSPGKYPGCKQDIQTC